MKDVDEPNRRPRLDDALDQSVLSSLSNSISNSREEVEPVEIQSRQQESITSGNGLEASATEETPRDVAGSQNDDDVDDENAGTGAEEIPKKPDPVVEWALANESLRSDATNRRETKTTSTTTKEETRDSFVSRNRDNNNEATTRDSSTRDFDRLREFAHGETTERGLSGDATDELFDVVDQRETLVYATEDEEDVNGNGNTIPVVREDVVIVHEPERRVGDIIMGYLVSSFSDRSMRLPSFSGRSMRLPSFSDRSLHHHRTKPRLFVLVMGTISLLMMLAAVVLISSSGNNGDLANLPTLAPTDTSTSSTSSSSLVVWRPLGAPLMYGCAVALSPNGDRLWGGDLGVLHVHDLILSSNAADSAASWKRTTDLSSYFKKVPSVAVSADGHVFVVGDPYHDDNAGAAFVFVRSDDVDGATTEWVQRGPTLTVENRTSGGFGQSVDVSGDGGVVVVGSFGNPVYAIYVHDALRNAYALQHRERVGDEDGTSVSLSSDASRLVVGVPGSNLAYVYNASSFSLPKRLQILEGYRQTAKDHFGDAVAISADGATVAVGARKGDYVRAYRASKDDDAYRSCDGRTLVGTEGSRFGFSVALSARGSRLVVGATHADAGGWGRAGEAVVFDLDPNNSKVSRVGELRGTAINERMGWSVAISDDGTRVALGGPSYPHLENPDVGGIRVYYEESFVDSNSSSLSLSSLSSSSNGGA